jgi:hypothetical protein
MSNRDSVIGWPSAIVACTFVALVGTVTTAAIVRYDVDAALKIWAALGSIVGVLTGAFVTYFFTSAAVAGAKENTATAQAQAAQAATGTAAARALADDRLAAIAKVAGLVEKDLWIKTLAADSMLARVLKSG